MSNEKKWVDDNHYRVTSDDGRTSWLYEADGGLFGRDSCVEVADHHFDGTTIAYEYSPGILDGLLHGGRGKKK